MLAHTLNAAKHTPNAKYILVSPPNKKTITAEAKRVIPHIAIATQTNPKGTAHAVQIALQSTPNPQNKGHILILYGDTPLIQQSTIAKMLQTLNENADCAICAFHEPHAPGYGKLLENAKGETIAIAEDDGSPIPSHLRDTGWKNAGFLAIHAEKLTPLLPKITSDNPQKERYLTDLVALAAARGFSCRRVECEKSESLGANNLAELAQLEAVYQNRLRQKMMRNGVRLTAPDTVHFSFDTRLEKGVSVAPYVVFGRGVRAGQGATIHAFSHIEGAEIAEGAEIGPFARIRPGASIGKEARIGNFVEVKNSALAKGVKASHLAYIGDAEIGAEANIGAGVITCNYDGAEKHKTKIGDSAFVGSNSALIAPVRIGAGAYVGSGSVIEEDVAPDSLALARAKQIVKTGWAAKWRKRRGSA